MLKFSEFWHIIRIFLVLTTASLVFGACTDMRDNNPAAHANNIPDLQSNIDLRQCVGASLLDSWAYFAPTGSDFPIPTHDGYRQVAKLYFKGQLGAANLALNETSFDSEFEAIWKVGDEFHKLYLDYVPQAYLNMCLGRMGELEELLPEVVSLSQGLDNKREKAHYDLKVRYHAKLLEWEIKLALANRSHDLHQFETLKEEIDKFSSHNDIEISNTAGVLSTGHLRFLNLKARINVDYAILVNDPLVYNLALKTFELIEDNFAMRSNRRQAYFSRTHGSPFEAMQFTRAMNLLHWMDSIQTQIEHRPKWLQDYSEQLEDYEKRIVKSFNSSRSKICKTPTQKEIQIIVNRKKEQLQCQPMVQITYTSMGLKTLKFTDLSTQFSKELFFEDSPMLWAQHQYLRYTFYRVYVNENRDNFHPKRTEELCHARRALENTLQVIPHLSYDRIVLNWC